MYSQSQIGLGIVATLIATKEEEIRYDDETDMELEEM